MQAAISASAAKEQDMYLHFEKNFFRDLEGQVIKKKMASGLKNILRWLHFNKINHYIISSIISS